MESITTQESHLLKQLGEKLAHVPLEGYKNTDAFLIRWIRARDNKLKDAEIMLRKHLEWCKENEINEILDWQPPPHIPKEFPFEIAGFSKIGCPVVVIPFGRWDIRGGVERGDKSILIRYIDQLFEMTEKVIREKSSEEKPVSQFILIFDLAQLGFSQLASVSAVEMVLEAVSRFEGNHPESLHSAFCINSSTVFSMLFKIVKPFLSPRTLGKVQIYGTNPWEWQPLILKEIEKDEIPPAFGGTASSSIKFYQEESQECNFTKVDISAGAKLPIEITAHNAPFILKWTFRSEDYDIGFEIRKKDDSSTEGNERVLIPFKKVESHIRSISGSLNCEVAGKYIFEFDNSYSRLRGKTIRYSLNMIKEEK